MAFFAFVPAVAFTSCPLVPLAQEHGCFDECTMGPNVRVGGDGPQTDNGPFPACKIVNGVKGEEAVSALLPPLP